MLPHLVSILTSSNGLAKGPAAGAIASMSSRPDLRSTVFQMGGLPGYATRRDLKPRPFYRDLTPRTLCYRDLTPPARPPAASLSGLPFSNLSRVRSLVSLLGGESDTSYHAVQAIAQFAADETYRTSLAETGGLGALTPLLSSHLPHVSQCALSAIANVSFVPGAVGQLAGSGALAHLGQMLFGAAEAESRMVLTALTNILSGAPQASDALVQVGGHMALLTQLGGPSADAQSQAAMAIGHMCRHGPALQAMLLADTVPLLCKLLYSPHPAAQLQAVYALGVMAAEDEAAASAVSLAGGVAPLTTLLLSSASVDVKQHLTLTLAHVIRGEWRSVFNVGGFQALLEVLSVGSDAVKQVRPLARSPTPSGPSLALSRLLSHLLGWIGLCEAGRLEWTRRPPRGHPPAPGPPRRYELGLVHCWPPLLLVAHHAAECRQGSRGALAGAICT